VYEPGLKERLLQYASMLLTMARHGIDPQIVSWNKVIFLHGEPGERHCTRRKYPLTAQLHE
jgi:hypothetical protein